MKRYKVGTTFQFYHCDQTLAQMMEGKRPEPTPSEIAYLIPELDRNNVQDRDNSIQQYFQKLHYKNILVHGYCDVIYPNKLTDVVTLSILKTYELSCKSRCKLRRQEQEVVQFKISMVNQKQHGF